MEQKKATSKTAKASTGKPTQSKKQPVKQATAELEKKPRAVRASKVKNIDPLHAASGHHHHKADSLRVETKSPAAVKPVVSHSQIAELAYSFYLERGHAHGRHEEDWRRAEKELTGK